MTTHPSEYVCNQCWFRVPADEIGVAIMQQHLHDHNYRDMRTKESAPIEETIHVTRPR